MTLQLELWQLLTFGVALAGSVVGGYWVLVTVIVRQFKAHLDERFKVQNDARVSATSDWNRRFDDLSKGVGDLDRRFVNHLAELPLKYQRREDAIRQEVGILHRLDGLADLVEQKFQITDQKIEKRWRGQ